MSFLVKFSATLQTLTPTESNICNCQFKTSLDIFSCDIGPFDRLIQSFLLQIGAENKT